MRCIAILVFVVACSGDHAPYTPLVTTHWVSFPADRELASGIVGVGGTAEDRSRVAAAVSTILIPKLHRNSSGDLRRLEDELEELRRAWDAAERRDANALVDIIVQGRMSEIALVATSLAEVRLHHDLWPNESLPDGWSDRAARVFPDPKRAAADLSHELDDMISRWPFAEDDNTKQIARHYATARNMIHVALTGDYSRTCGNVYKALIARGVMTRPVPNALGPW